MATPQFSKSYVRISACTLNTVWFYPDTDMCQALNTQKKKITGILLEWDSNPQPLQF